MQELGNTQFFKVETDNNSVKKILEEVYRALTEKGYNPVNQIVLILQAITTQEA